ncbi:recombination-associated protein RdgC [Candidatus Synchoanobacter obligatus]|uniref:Recombination-associated protein RdgC n=1 Tax=Candidatus Synchoanobacter obligatus TaxID=2919597 RepID=A0ABT1L5I9_9GAMM|nr:recombination-associated protein RdgC [Candidatus Synchoanobacter obligatus]MCP8352437.1 recombination-associated protein RdgC [Candidatus Synchoanobacter obligatus]
MWLKQVSWFDMRSNLLLEGEALEEALSQKQAYKPHATQSRSLGWVSPLGEGHPLCVESGSYLWLAVRIDQKLLPANVVKDVVAEKLAEQEAMQGYPPTNKQRRVMKDEVTLDLLPKAFVVSKKVQVIVDHDNKLLMVDSTSASVKDVVIDLLRQTVGSLPLTHYIEQRTAISHVLKNWVTEPPEGIDIESEYTLINPNDVNAKARVTGLDESAILGHLSQGMTVSQLMVQYHAQLKFQMTDQLDFSRVKFLNFGEEEKLDDPIAQAMADFSLTVPYFTQIIKACKTWFPLEQTEEEEAVNVIE